MAEDFKINCLTPVIYKYDSEGKPLIMYPCKKCILCRSKKRREWATRMECETMYSRSSFFITLTYNEYNIYKHHGVTSLNKKHLQDFIKRLRNHLPCKMRHFSVGEYGSRTGRPHYHLCCWLNEKISKSDFSSIVTKCWSSGFSKSCRMEQGHCYYIAKYCTKDSSTPFGAVEPFQLVSRDPPIGYRFFEDNNDLFESDFNINYLRSPSFRTSSLPRSFEKKIKDKLSGHWRKTFEDPAQIRSKNLRWNQSLKLRQYVKDFNNLKPGQFLEQRDNIERRLTEKLHKSSKL